MQGDIEFLDFVGVGAPRSGTTWLAEVLGQHPEIWTPSLKELNFFNKPFLGHMEFRYLRGLDFYRRFFEGAPAGALLGEVTPCYYVDLDSAERIAKHFPRAKILMMLRNPVDVVYSTWLKMREYEVTESTFEAEIERRPELLDLGYYSRNLLPYFKTFPRENIYVGVYEQTFRHPEQACVELYRFLGVDSTFRPAALNTRVNPRRTVKYPALVQAQHYARLCVNTKPLLPIKLWLTGNGKVDMVRERLLKWNLKAEAPPPVSDRTRSRLADLYREDSRQLNGITGADFSMWAIQ